MWNEERKSVYPHCPAMSRVVQAGGCCGVELLDDLRRAGVEVNEYGKQLLLSEAFRIAGARRSVVTVELAVRELGFADGGRMSEIVRRATEVGLSLCPIEVGPYLRLQYLDQPEGFWGFLQTQHRAPAGSITVASPPVSDDDAFPKGFYLRRIQGVLWLRGYCSDDEQVWNPGDRLVFCQE